MRTQGMRCMLSGLSEPVGSGRVGILLLQSKSEKETHGDREYEIMTPPLWGGYDGYGGVLVDDAREPVGVAVQAYLKEHGAQVDNLDHIADLIQYCGPVHVTYDGWDRRDVSYALVRWDVWRSVKDLALEDAVMTDPRSNAREGLRSSAAILSELDQKLMDGLDMRLGSNADTELRYAFSEYGPMPRFFRDFVQDLGEAPIPSDIFESAKGVYLVTKMMPRLGIPLTPRMFTVDESNVSLKKRFFRSMVQVCASDMDEEG